MNEAQLLIGWGEADITPANTRVELSGQYYQRIATGVHSHIKVNALALSSGNEQALFVTLDTVGIPEDLQEEIAQTLHRDFPELKESAVLLNAIHTHNAPYCTPQGLFREWLPLDAHALSPAEYVEFLKLRILAAARTAWTGRAPGGIARAFGNARIGHCRRAVYRNGTAEMYGDTTREDFVGLEAGEDSGVEMVFTFDQKRQPTGMIVNVACPSQVMEATYLISSDYMGATREKLKRRFGENFHTLCQISAAGCQSPRDLTRAYKQDEPDCWHASGVDCLSDRLSRAITDAAARLDLAGIEFAPVMKSSVVPVELPRRRVSFTQYEAARKELARLTAIQPLAAAFKDFYADTRAHEKIDGPGPYDSKLHHFVRMENEMAIIQRYDSQDQKPNYRFDMHVLRLGDLAVVSNPFELYLLYGQIIKARSAARQTLIVQLTGGEKGGYLPSPDAERFGGYGGCVINGQVGSDGGFKYVEAAVAAIGKLFE